jgi:glutamine kinase
MPNITFGTKAETLEILQGCLRSAKILPILRFSYKEWQDRDAIYQNLLKNDWSETSLIIRSSSQSEDGQTQSKAGQYLSIGNVQGYREFFSAVDQVFASYGKAESNDQVFVQPYLSDAINVGVLFTADPTTGAPYFIISSDPQGGADTITAGTSNTLSTVYHHCNAADPVDPFHAELVVMARELMVLLDEDSLDIEFGVSSAGELYLFQVRPLVLNTERPTNPEVHFNTVSMVADKVKSLIGPHPFLLGERTMFGTMPDWNPAEIIGVRPRPLALSLYRELITDSVWAYQRNNYGYRNLRSFPLLKSFHGLPYVDVRVSYNSFIPSDLNEDLGNRLVDYYLDRLEEEPSLHDKVEFEIVFSCYTPDLNERMSVLDDYGFSSSDKELLSNNLKTLTQNIINNDTGIWRQDLNKLENLPKRRERIINSNLDKVSKIYWLLEDCKRYGTLPFAGLARAAFISIQLLKSFVNIGIFDDINLYLNSLDTVSGKITRDFHSLNKQAFLDKYGHLRPGTYDILSPRYDEKPELYFDWTTRLKTYDKEESSFQISSQQYQELSALLSKHHFENSVDELFNFIKKSIEGREFGKFIFSQNLSAAIQILGDLGKECGISNEDMSYANIQAVYEAFTSSMSARNIIIDSIMQGKETFSEAKQISLPSLITSDDQILSFQTQPSEPNYITHQTATAKITDCTDRERMRNAIVMIPSADPGFDWIFSHDIAGLITAYGGVNSHMAIRAGELNLPAVIGAGEDLFEKWSQAKVLRIDCAARRVEILNMVSS